ncbi:TPA: hypothetical protein ACH3X3_005398 [Trebouxia sp. C0006]
MADSLQQLVSEVAQSFEQHVCEIVEQLARATTELLTAPYECSAQSDCAEDCHFAAEAKLITAMSAALDKFPGAGSSCLREGTWPASLCDRLSLSANMMMLNHQPADPQVAAFMLRMIAQALQVQPVSCPLPERSTQLRAARAATVNTQSAALMQRTDDVLIMGISALAVVVLRLASEEQRTFTLATLPIHHDFWVSTLLLLIEALQQHAGHRLGIHSASQQRQQQPEMALQDRAGTAEVSSSLRRALWHRQRLTVPEYEQLQEHMMAWYANEVWAAGHPSRGRVFQCTDYWCARADKIA